MSSPAAPEDEQLMAAYAAGDARAFEMLYDRHEARLWRYVLRSVGDAANADELAQEVWFSVARQAGAYRPTAGAAGRRWFERSPAESPAERAAMRCLAELPGPQREAFLLQAEAGMGVAEIAAATGVGPETAKSRLRYARAALRRALEHIA